MHRRIAVATSIVVLVAACRAAGPAASPAPAPAAPPAKTVAPWDTAAPARAQMVQDVMRSIAGREQQAAESVFKNLQMPALKSVRAGQLLQIMNLGYARSLGVGCEHCHVPGKWEADDKPAKGIARGMIRMANQLTPTLRAIPNINQQAVVNCTTCHRGSVKPALNLPPQGS